MSIRNESFAHCFLVLISEFFLEIWDMHKRIFFAWGRPSLHPFYYTWVAFKRCILDLPVWSFELLALAGVSDGKAKSGQLTREPWSTLCTSHLQVCLIPFGKKNPKRGFWVTPEGHVTLLVFSIKPEGREVFYARCALSLNNSLSRFRSGGSRNLSSCTRIYLSPDPYHPAIRCQVCSPQ